MHFTQMLRVTHRLLALVCLWPLGLQAADSSQAPNPRTQFINYKTWPDDQGRHINAHGGGILFHQGVYYWFGEHKTEGGGGNVAQVGIHCYRSTDLYNWADAGIALAVSPDPASEITAGSIIERPKVIYNAATQKFVMWFHLELKGQGYKAARAGIAVADQPAGPYTYLRSLRANAGVWPQGITEKDKEAGPNNYLQRDFAGGQMSRDMTLFVDNDNKAYHITSSEDNKTLHIHELSGDYLDYTGRYGRIFPGGCNEAPAICHYKGRYWLLTSGLTGWSANPARSAVADSIWGPWKALGNPCRGLNEGNHISGKMTWGGQSTFILPVSGRPGAYIAMFDIWRPKNAIDGRYVWLPIQFGENDFRITWQDSWDLSVFDGSWPPYEPSVSPEKPLMDAQETRFVLSTPESGCTLRYTLDGSEPTATSTIYTQPVVVKKTTRVRALAERNGRCSTVITQDYIMAPASAAGTPEVVLESLEPLAAETYGQPLVKGKSVARKPLTLKGKVYTSGLGTGAPARLVYALDPAWRRFVATAGMDEGAENSGAVSFVVSFDDVVTAVSPVLKRNQAPWQFDIAIPAGARKITLEVEEQGSGRLPEQADWVNAGFILDPASVPGTSTGL